MSFFRYKLKQAKHDGYILGYASQIEVATDSVLIRGRVVPRIGVIEGKLQVTPVELSDLNLPGKGWAVWAYPCQRPQWAQPSLAEVAV